MSILFFIYFSTLLSLSTAKISTNASLALHLERAFPHQAVTLHQLHTHDRKRVKRHIPLGTNATGPAFGIPDSMLYFTTITLGTPGIDFNVDVDTGSDLTWSLHTFNPFTSSTAATVDCGEPYCDLKYYHSGIRCSDETDQCIFSGPYDYRSEISIIFYADLMRIPVVFGNLTVTTSSTPVIFGCANNIVGDLTDTRKATDGVIGLRPKDTSVVSQLESRGLIPRVISHCLKGDGNGGGILVFGELVEPHMAYTPMVSRTEYSGEMNGITVNGQMLPIDPFVFTMDNIKEPFFTRELRWHTLLMRHMTNYLGSKPEDFPVISFDFVGGSMMLKPQDYLVDRRNLNDNTELWCVGIRRTEVKGTIIIG
ncbi:Xylanase inhibitor, N-terminal, partial [Dillenia turbinata]